MPARLAPLTSATLPSRRPVVTIGFSAADDPHGEELRRRRRTRDRARVARRRPGARPPCPRTCSAASAKRSMPGRADRVGRQHAAGRVDRQVAVERGRAVVDHLPAVALVGEAEVLHPHRLVPAERHVDLGAVDVAARVGDAGLRVDVRRAVATGVRVHQVAAGDPSSARCASPCRGSTPAGSAPRSRRPRRRARSRTRRRTTGTSRGSGSGPTASATRAPCLDVMSGMCRCAYGFFSALSRSFTATMMPMWSGRVRRGACRRG